MSKNMKEFEQSYETLSAFDKWYKKERQRRRGAPMYSADYRTGWKAALEWIHYEGVLDSTLAGDLIKKELDNESL